MTAFARRAFDDDNIPIWDFVDYSEPETRLVGHAREGDVVYVVKRCSPCHLIITGDGRVGWLCAWNVDETGM